MLVSDSSMILAGLLPAFEEFLKFFRPAPVLPRACATWFILALAKALIDLYAGPFHLQPTSPSEVYSHDRYSPASVSFSSSRHPLLHRSRLLCAPASAAAAQGNPAPKPAANPEPDVLVLSNGDTLHGKFVSEIAGKVTFHSDPLGDISLGWDKIKELHTSQKVRRPRRPGQSCAARKQARQIPVGTLEVANQAVTVHPENAAAEAPIPVKNAQYIMDPAEIDKQINHQPGFFSGWNGAATAGATLVAATQNQYTVSGGIGLVRAVPTASWLNPRDRTSVDFTGSFGKIIQPAYTSGATTVPAVVTKSAIYHADAERDEYFSPALLCPRPDRLRPQLRPGPRPAADLRRRLRLDRAENPKAGSRPERNGAVRKAAVHLRRVPAATRT